MVAGESVEKGRGPQDEQQRHDEHADGRGEIGPGEQIEGQVEQQHRHHAEVDVVVPVVVGHIEQVGLAGLLLGLVAGALVVGILHVLEPLGRLLLQIQLAFGHGLGQHGVLLGVVAAHLEGVHERRAVPSAVVVGRGGHAHEVRAVEEERRRKRQLDGHGEDDARLRLARVLDNANAVDGRLGTERVAQKQQPENGHKAQRVEGEGAVGIQGNAVQEDGVGDVLPHYLDAQVLHIPGGLQVDELARIHHRGHARIGDADGVLRGVEIGLVGRVGELDLHGDVLGRLIGVEIDADVAHLGVQAGELERVIHISEQKGTLVVALELNTVVQVDGSIARRSEEVDIEDEDLQRQGDKSNDRHRPGHLQQGTAVDEHEMLEGVGYVLAHSGHEGDYTVGADLGQPSQAERQRTTKKGRPRSPPTGLAARSPAYRSRASLTSAYTTFGSRSPSMVTSSSQPR